MDKQSGFNLLQAAVLDGEYNIVRNAHGLLDDIIEEMELVTTGNNAKYFPGKTAVDILSLIKLRTPSHDRIERLYKEWAKDNSRPTELQWGTCNDDAEQAVEFVLNDGVDINARGSDNDWTALLKASRSSSSQFIETLIDLGADVNAQREDNKFSPLILAADWNNYMAACLFVKRGTDVNVQNSNGFTPLHLSLKMDHENLVKLLLSNKADVNIQGNCRYTPLHHSVIRNGENLVSLLLKHHPDVNIQDKYGYTPSHRAVVKSEKNLVKLLLQHKADVNIQDNEGKTPLHRCIESNENLFRLYVVDSVFVKVIRGDKNLVRLLLEYNADVAIQDNDGYTPLDLSASYGRSSKTINLIVKNRPQSINRRDAKGLSPLQRAVRFGNAQAVKKPLDLGAYISAVSADSKDSIEMERLKNEAEKTERHPKFKIVSVQEAKETGAATSVTIGPAAEKLTGPVPDESEVEQVKTLALSHRKSKATASSTFGKAKAVKKRLDLGVGISEVYVEMKDPIEVERLKTEADRMERNPKFKILSVQEAEETEAVTSATIVLGADKLTGPVQDEPEAEQVKTLAVSHPKSKATASSRTNKCVMA